MRGWWLFAVLIACGDAGRADDCQALEVLLHAPEEMEVSMHHGQMPDTLATHDWQNPDVRAAVKKFLSPAGRHSLGRPDTGWTLYTPYTVAPQNRDLLGLFDSEPRTSRFAPLHDVCPAVAISKD